MAPRPPRKIHPMLAIALKYVREQDVAPWVVAKGRGRVAQRIRELAVEAGIPIQKDEALAGALEMLEVEQQVPPELYEAVAEVLAFLYRADHQAKRSP
jgi:flagellar biosynthesis protein